MSTAPPIAPPRSARSALQRHALRALLLAAVVGAPIIALSASRHSSTTFDEIVMMSAGAAGLGTGRFDLLKDQPPVMQYLYGLPIVLARPQFPPPPPRSALAADYGYAQQFFWSVGNDPERLALLGRSVAAAIVAALVLAVFLLTRRAFDRTTAVLAAVLVAFLPDVLAHGGVAYNDLPLALAVLGGVFALDAAARVPTPARAAIAGAAVTLAIGVKTSAVALIPIACSLVACEAVARGRDAAWLRRLALALPLGAAAAYLTLVVLYRGDASLSGFFTLLAVVFDHARSGHGVPAYLFGRESLDGFRYFFPVAFLLKTPAALHALMALAALGLVRTAGRPSRAWLRSPLRAAVIGAVVLLAFLVAANLNIGFRHALPVLPLVCILVAVGVVRLWRVGHRALRPVVVALLLWFASSALSGYPHFLAYLSEYVRDRDRAYRVLVDSSVDWGQGLLELRDFMRDEGIDRIYLSYFGSALPEGYGIDYVPMLSFFPFPPRPLEGEEPAFAAISATNVAGVYLDGDPYAGVRDLAPYRVLAGSLYVYRIDHGPLVP